MKKLSLTVILVLGLATLAFAHEGSVGLFREESAVHCDVATDPAIFEQVEMYVVYDRSDAGPDGITGIEFKMEVTPSIQFSSAEWQQGFVTLGDVMTGISVVANGCFGSGMQYVPFGTITVFLVDTSNLENEYARLVPDPGLAEPPSVYVTTCEEGYPLHAVLGGWYKFKINSCNTSVAPTSWGAIKTIYKD